MLTLEQEITKNYADLQMMSMRLCLGDYNMAQDVLHDALERTLRFREIYKPGDTFMSWVYAIMRNIRLNYFRNDTTRREREEEYVNKQLSKQQIQSLDYDFTKLLGKAADSLDSLSEAKRETVELNMQGYQIREISLILDIPEGTVRSRLFYALQHIRGKL